MPAIAMCPRRLPRLGVDHQEVGQSSRKIVGFRQNPLLLSLFPFGDEASRFQQINGREAGSRANRIAFHQGPVFGQCSAPIARGDFLFDLIGQSDRQRFPYK